MWYTKDGRQYPPQKVPLGADEALRVMREGCPCAGHPDPCETCRDKTVRMWTFLSVRGPHLCGCPHVEDGTNHQHTFFRCADCGGLCTAEKWTPQAVSLAKYMLMLEIGHLMHQIALETKEVAVACLGEHQRKAIEAAFSHFGRRRIDATIQTWEEPSGALTGLLDRARLAAGDRPALGDGNG